MKFYEHEWIHGFGPNSYGLSKVIPINSSERAHLTTLSETKSKLFPFWRSVPFQCDKFLTAVVYGIFDDSNTLQYIGCTLHFKETLGRHRRTLKSKSHKTALYEKLSAMDWEMKVIEEYPCPSMGYLYKRKFELIEENRPPCNFFETKINECNCKRLLKNRNICRICDTIQRQQNEKTFHILEPLSSSGSLVCKTCGSYGCPKSMEENCIFCEDLPASWSHVDLITEHDSCPFSVVFIKRGTWNQSVASNEAKHTHVCDDECEARLEKWKKKYYAPV